MIKHQVVMVRLGQFSTIMMICIVFLVSLLGASFSFNTTNILHNSLRDFAILALQFKLVQSFVLPKSCCTVDNCFILKVTGTEGSCGKGTDHDIVNTEGRETSVFAATSCRSFIS